MTLQLIQTEPAPLPVPVRQPRVFNAERSVRLANLNAALRGLRTLGVRVLDVCLDGEFPAPEGEPLVRIEHDPDRSFGAFLDAVGPRTYVHLVGTPKRVGAHYQGVTLLWEES